MTDIPMASLRPAALEPRTERLFAKMIRLWLEHHQRVIDLGLGPN